MKSLTPEPIRKVYRDYQERIRKSAHLAKYKGDAVHCPICGSSFKQFAPGGVKRRANAKCHNCGSLERHRLLYLFFRERFPALLQEKEPVRLLHFAPERMLYPLFSRNPSIAYTPCDLFPELYTYQGAAKVHRVDITEIPFPDGSFDFILCNHVLEHIPDDGKAMAELYRVLAVAGHGILQIPIDRNRATTYEDPQITSPEEREKHFGQKDHVRWYGRDYTDRLKQAGFHVEENAFISTFSAAEQFRFGLSANETIFLVSK